MRALPFLLIALALSAGEAAAQRPAPDSAAVQPVPFGRSVTLPAILAEYRQLQLRPRPDSVASTDPVLGIQGLVVDETATPAGRSFYDVFYLVWSPPPAAARATVALSEQPLPGNSTAIIIRVDGEILVQTRLPRRPDEIEELAVQAAQFVASRLSGS